MATTSVSVADLTPLLERLNDATVSLRQSKDRVPDEVRRLVENLDTELHTENSLALGAHPDVVVELYGAVIRAQKALRRPVPAVQRREVRLPLEQIRVLVAQIIEDAPYGADVSVEEVLHNLVGRLRVPQREIAELLDVAPRTLQRWLAPGATVPPGAEESRVRLVAQLVNQLRHSFTPTGVVAWFHRQHPLLEARPIDQLGDPDLHRRLLQAAQGSRSAP